MSCQMAASKSWNIFTLILRQLSFKDSKEYISHTENSMQYGYDENDNNNMSNETKWDQLQHQQKVEQHAQHAPHQARHQWRCWPR